MEIRIWGYIDATMEIQESILIGPFSRMQGSSGGFLELLCGFGNWLFCWVFDALVDIMEDVQFRTSELQAFQHTDCKCKGNPRLPDPNLLKLLAGPDQTYPLVSPAACSAPDCSTQACSTPDCSAHNCSA
jgi:hypothetical protein